jgi:hypothetical protein
LQIANNLKDAERVEKKEAAAEEAAANVRPTDAARSHGNVSFWTLGPLLFRPRLGADFLDDGIRFGVFFFFFSNVHRSELMTDDQEMNFHSKPQLTPPLNF